MATPVPSNPAFRKTSAATKLGKALFSKNSQAQITPAQITNLLRLSGINVPPELAVGADVAQIIMAGGMIVSDIDKAASIRSFAAPTALAIQATLELLTVTGLADASSPMMQMMKYGAETAAVVSSAGTNVIADLSLALDTYQQISKSTRGTTLGAIEFFATGGVGAVLDEAIFGSSRLKDMTSDLQSIADSSAKAKVLKTFQAQQQAQVTQAGTALANYNSGKISIFELMGTIATQEPFVFYNYFPQLKVFLPPHLFQLSVSSEVTYTQSGGLFNLATRSYDVHGGYSQTFDSSGMYSQDQIMYAIYRYFTRDIVVSITAPFKPVMDHVENFYPEYRISNLDLVALSTFPPHFDKIDSTMNLAFTLRNLGLTPYDLGYEFVEDMKSNYHIFPELQNVIAQTPAITFNGVDYFTTSQQAIQKALKTKQALVDQLVAWDKAGDIQSLAANPTGQAMIKRWGDSFGAMLNELKTSLLLNDPTATPASASWKAIMSGQVEPKRSIKNYFALLSISKTMEADPYMSQLFKDWGTYVAPISALFEDRVRDIQFLSLGRLLNSNALNNIASFFGTTAPKIRLAPPDSGKLGFLT